MDEWRIGVRFPAEHREAVEKAAAQRGCSVNALIVNVVLESVVPSRDIRADSGATEGAVVPPMVPPGVDPVIVEHEQRYRPDGAPVRADDKRSDATYMKSQESAREIRRKRGLPEFIPTEGGFCTVHGKQDGPFEFCQEDLGLAGKCFRPLVSQKLWDEMQSMRPPRPEGFTPRA